MGVDYVKDDKSISMNLYLIKEILSQQPTNTIKLFTNSCFYYIYGCMYESTTRI